jgi:hypothetical protein
MSDKGQPHRLRSARDNLKSAGGKLPDVLGGERGSRKLREWWVRFGTRLAIRSWHVALWWPR